MAESVAGAVVDVGEVTKDGCNCFLITLYFGKYLRGCSQLVYEYIIYGFREVDFLQFTLRCHHQLAGRLPTFNILCSAHYVAQRIRFVDLNIDLALLNEAIYLVCICQKFFTCDNVVEQDWSKKLHILAPKTPANLPLALYGVLQESDVRTQVQSQ